MPTAHIIAHTAPSWGHMKPLLALMAKVAERRPAASVVLSVLTGEPLLPKVKRELELMPKYISERINIIDIGPPKSLLEPALGFIPAFKDLWEGNAVQVTSGSNCGKRTLPKPSAIILDIFCDFALPVIKEVSDGKCPIIAWFSAPVSHCLEFFGPESLGGHGDLAAKIDAAAKETGKTPTEVADSVYRRCEGKVMQTPGLPPRYDYDAFPQEDIFPFSPAIIIKNCHKMILSCNDFMAVTASAFEKESITACRSWLKGSGIDTFIVGPLEDVPSAVPATDSVAIASLSEDDKKVLTFLDNMQAKHGDRSVIYIAFGTYWSPKDPTKLHAFIDEIVASGAPVLWGHASPFAAVPQELADKINASPNAFHTNWTPQREVLKHSATGWYVAHGGWNGMQEAMSLRVPMIMWPFGGDQPSNTSLMSVTHGAAFELVSVRSGDGARQPYHLRDQAPVDFSVDGVRKEARELFVKLRGEEGEKVRRNAGALGAEMSKSWLEPAGEAATQTEAFLKKYVD